MMKDDMMDRGIDVDVGTNTAPFSERYKPGQQVWLVIPGEGVYHPTIKHYDGRYNEYVTDTLWYICSTVGVFETEEELNEYLKDHPVTRYRGPSEWCGSTRHRGYEL